MSATSSDGVYFDWNSNIGVDAVIVKGGPNSDAFVYDPGIGEVTLDTDLHAPVINGSPFGLSHIEFCYDVEPQVSKTADTSLDRTFKWTIDKAVTPDTWVLFKGDSGTSKYTVCENPVPAGFTSFWKLDGQIVTPYNPGDSKVPKEDIGIRCYDFTASAGQSPAFEIDNSHPDGDPRTIGYWKNWNTCTGENQAATAAKNGGAAAGVFLLNDLLPQTIGDLLLPKSATGCQQAVKILSKQNLSGQNKASDAAYELASQLLAAKVNLAAGAKTCTSVQTAIMNAQTLLANGPTDTPKGVNFNGTGSYLPSNTKLTTLRTQALSLAATLDKYNNGDLC